MAYSERLVYYHHDYSSGAWLDLVFYGNWVIDLSDPNCARCGSPTKIKTIKEAPQEWETDQIVVCTKEGCKGPVKE